MMLIDLSLAANKLSLGAVGIIPTDTIYGLVASALHNKSVERVYAVKGRAPTKPCIILISEIDDVERFGCNLTDELRARLTSYWPGPVSIILPTESAAPELHRGTNTLAFRLPDDEALRVALKVSGPIIAPSANPEGLLPAETVAQAEKYFGEKVDFYVDGGERRSEPSALISINRDIVKILRTSSYFKTKFGD